MAFSIMSSKTPSESSIPPGLWQIGTQQCLSFEEKKDIGREMKACVFPEVAWCSLTACSLVFPPPHSPDSVVDRTEI